ncbi:MFS transporter [Streptacidiphilus cavernicola]|uniref:MFS transporter n=1 Tax=Streptacidiphilus cavernicola TaxID=3342716 RepID=A0ABV6W628_9ACTN
MTSDSSPPKPSLWRHRDFLLLWSGGAVSDVGTAVSTLVLPLIAVRTLDASVFQVALLTVMIRLPSLVLTLPAGVIVDRVRNRRMLMIWCDVGRMLAVGSIPLATVFGSVTMWQLALAALAIGTFRVFFDVADQSYLPTLLTREQLVDGNGKLRASETLADSLGPSLGAALSGVFGAARAISLDSITYAVSVLTLVLIRTPETGREAVSGAPRVGFRAAMGEGLRFVFGDAILRRIAACTATANLAIGVVTSLEVVFLIRSVHSSPTQIGIVLGLGTLGGFAGSLMAHRLAQRVGTARIMWVALVVPAPLTFLIPLAWSGWGALVYGVGWAAFNASGAVYNTAQISYRQAMCPPELLGRVNASIRWLIWSTVPASALIGGGLATWLGLRPTLWIGATIMALTGMWLVFSPLRGMRDIPIATMRAGTTGAAGAATA